MWEATMAQIRQQQEYLLNNYAFENKNRGHSQQQKNLVMKKASTG